MSDVHASKLRMIGFSLPALSLNMLLTAVFVIIPPLYAEHRGLGAATVGLVFLLAKMVDMIAAPAWGLFMDSYKTRWGRRRPWLTLSAPILVTAIFFLYNPPEAVTGLYLFAGLAILYIAIPDHGFIAGDGNARRHTGCPGAGGHAAHGVADVRGDLSGNWWPDDDRSANQPGYLPHECSGAGDSQSTASRFQKRRCDPF
jgi:MFS family permease